MSLPYPVSLLPPQYVRTAIDRIFLRWKVYDFSNPVPSNHRYTVGRYVIEYMMLRSPSGRPSVSTYIDAMNHEPLLMSNVQVGPSYLHINLRFKDTGWMDLTLLASSLGYLGTKLQPQSQLREIKAPSGTDWTLDITSLYFFQSETISDERVTATALAVSESLATIGQQIRRSGIRRLLLHLVRSKVELLPLFDRHLGPLKVAGILPD